MKSNYRAAAFAALACAAMAPLRAGELPLPRDGWASWQVPAVDGAPAWCCFSSWKHADDEQMTCQLDGQRQGYGTRNHDDTTDAVKVYARLSAGRVERLQVLSASCPVETRTPVLELSGIATDDSARWLATQVRQGRVDEDENDRDSVGRDALAALAMHRGEVANQALVGFTHHPRASTRKWSVFWLAQSGNPGAEQAIGAALRNDTDDEVREHAVFALSLLPGERSTKALIAAAEDQTLSREQRKRAVFWLSQSEMPSAQAYLDQILARTSH